MSQQYIWPSQAAAVSVGGATAANQVLEIASLDATEASAASIDSKLTSPLTVTGPLTDTQLRATAVPVTGPLTDTQLRATAVPVSGPLTDTQLRAAAVPVSLTSTAVTGTVAVAQVKAATSTLSNVAGSVSSVTLLASNANRKNAAIYNDSTANLYVKLGATASATSFTVLMLPGAYYELPVDQVYTGIIDGIWVSATGNARVTELT